MPEEKVSLLVQARDTASRVIEGVRARLTGLRTSALSLGPVFKGVFGGLAAFFGARAVARFTADTVRMFYEQERAASSLRVALARAGETGDEAFRRLTSGALDLQAALNLDDEAMVRATTRVSQFVPAFKVGELERVQFVLAGLTSITGDLDSSGQLLGKSLAGQTNILARYGITMDAAASPTEKLSQLIRDPKLKTGFEILAGNARTTEGRVIAASLAFGDLRESLGGVLVDMFTVGEGASTLATKIRELDAWVNRNRNTITGYGRSITGTFELVINVGKTAFEILGTVAAAGVSLIIGAFQRLRLEAQLANNWLAEQSRRGAFGFLMGVSRRVTGAPPISQIDTQPAAQALADTMLQQRELSRILGGLKDDMSADFDEWLAGYVQTTAEAVAGAGVEVEEAIEQETTGTGKAGKVRIPDRPFEGTEEDIAAREQGLRALMGPSGFLPFESTREFTDELARVRNEIAAATGAGMTFGQVLRTNLVEGQGHARELHKVLADTAAQGIMGLGSAVESTVADVVSGSKTMGEAFAGAWRGAVAMAANAMADFYQAQAVAAVAAALGGPAVGGGPQGWAAAAKFGAASLAMRAVAGIARGMGGVGGGSAASGAFSRGADQIGRAGPASRVTIYGSFLDMSDPRQADRLAEAFSTLAGRRIELEVLDRAA